MHHWDPGDYARNSQAQEQWAEQLITGLEMNGRERVLDIGCGDGRITAGLAGRADQGWVVGADLSSDMVRYAASHHPPARYPNLSFVRADARYLPLKGPFDLVFSNAALHWVQDHRSLLAAVYRSLAPGGTFLAQMGGKGNAADVMDVVLRVTAEPGWSPYFAGFSSPYAFFSAEDYRGFLDESGFRVKRALLLERDMVQAGREGFAGWVRTTWHPYLYTVPPSRREEFLTRVVDQYIGAHPADREGNVHVRMVRLEVEAVRPPGPGLKEKE
jgi:trans-aconitate methyltransferase